MKTLNIKCHVKKIKWKKLFFVANLLFLFSASSFSGSNDDILLIVHDRVITKNEFLYHFLKNKMEINQENIAEFLESFIDFQLKIAEAKEELIHHNIGFINELAEYRLQLAAQYLTDYKMEKKLANEAFERLKFEVKTNYICIRLDRKANSDDTLKAYNNAIEIRNRILGGEAFEQIEISKSDNLQIIRDSGNFDYFTAFQTEYSLESVVYKMKPGEISMPIRTSLGYHIIQLIDKRKNLNKQKTEQEIIRLIKEAKDERIQIIQDSFIEKLKDYWDFKENTDALYEIFEFADEKVYKGNWVAPADQSFDKTIFFIDGKSVLQRDFIDFMQSIEGLNRNLSVKDYIFLLYKQFVSKKLIQYENYKLTDKYPEFRYQYEEYRDAMLLLQITKQKVWLKAESDRAGLEKFFIENKYKYVLGSENKSLDEVYDIVQVDYQNYLMNQWIDGLHSKYRIQIINEVLSTIK